MFVILKFWLAETSKFHSKTFKKQTNRLIYQDKNLSFQKHSKEINK